MRNKEKTKIRKTMEGKNIIYVKEASNNFF